MGKLRSLIATGALPENYAAEYDGSGMRARATRNGVLSTYSFGLLEETAGVGNTVYTPGVSQRKAGVDRFFHSDWIGSLRYLTDSTGLTTPTAYRFDAYGGLSASLGPDSTTSKFAGGHGYESDGPGGMQLLGHRYYDPALGRFLNPDPIGFAGGLNLYAYCFGNPVGFVDPSGLDPVFGEGMDRFRLITPNQWGDIPYRPRYVLRRPTLTLPPEWVRNLLAMADVGGGADVVALASGTDPLTNERVTGCDYGLFVLGAVLPGVSGSQLRTAKKMVSPRGGTYLLRDPITDEVMRSGRTNNLRRRQLEHARDADLRDYGFEAVHHTDDYAEQRGLERILHEQYKPPLNKVGGVSRDRKKAAREAYAEAARRYLEARGQPK